MGDLETLLTAVLSHPKGSMQRRKAMSRFLSTLQPFLEQWIARRRGHHDKKVHPDLGQALNDSLAWVAEHIDEFDVSCSNWKKEVSVQQALINWVLYKGRLDYRIRDLEHLLKPNEIPIDAFEPGSAEYQANEPLSSSELDEIIQEGKIDFEQVPTLSGLDQVVQAWQRFENKKRTAIEQALQYIKTDPEGKLRACFSRDRPDCNCHILFLRVTLEQSTDNLSELARELNIKTQTLHTLKRRCRKLVEELVINHLGFNPLLIEA
ncbi:hypothetical protein [Leptolyngbya sp. GGD]|uniref:hypothetical protein n=1 Tax=Leptolyngbya sp. GGD TaxID=2997907 RepID=UPI00227A6568|nr:hypothetical protein [Leptolyngbya sp. GGD]MCY6494269.1 hypothetical protein [Leptolyngbya sp. GGD]